MEETALDYCGQTLFGLISPANGPMPGLAWENHLILNYWAGAKMLYNNIQK